MSALLLCLYFFVLAVLSGVGLHRLVATVASRWYVAPPGDALPITPSVLVQLPLYNEACVAERLLLAVAKLRYPATNLHIQVLDDSTDETRRVVDRVVGELRTQGVSIEVVRRPNREGYKAGALAHGLKQFPQADAVAIFDADFVPQPSFLEEMVPRLFAAPDVGLVQARWGHLNRDHSLLTKAQGVFLDGHFAIEHAARMVLHHPFNFNGTAGVWRAAAIEEGGGWQGDTVTEDLDLSYRAQLQGWRFVYAHDVVAPAELPESWAAFRSQQARWVRGSVETARKLLGRVLRSPRLSLAARLDAAIHLTNNFAYLFMGMLACLLPLALVVREELGWRVPGGRALLSWLDMFMLAVGTLAMVVFYVVALWKTRSGVGARIGDILFGLCLGAGMSLSNSTAVVQGLWSRQSTFVRTPKKGDRSSGPRYAARSKGGLILSEGLFAIYFAAAVGYAIHWQVWGALPFLSVYLVGFASVCLCSAFEALSGEAADEAPRSPASIPPVAKRSRSLPGAD